MTVKQLLNQLRQYQEQGYLSDDAEVVINAGGPDSQVSFLDEEDLDVYHVDRIFLDRMHGKRVVCLW